MNKYKKRFIFLMIVCFVIGIIGLTAIIFCGLTIDWYQNLTHKDYMGIIDFIISILPTVLCGTLSAFGVYKIGYIACEYENAKEIIKQYYNDALHGKKTESINQTIIENRLKSVGYNKLEKYDLSVFYLNIKRFLKRDISSFVIVVNDECVEQLYGLIMNHCSSVSEEKPNSKLCISVLYFGDFNKKFVRKHIHENRDDDVIINSAVYDNKNNCLHMLSPDSLYSKAFQKMSASILSLYE